MDAHTERALARLRDRDAAHLRELAALMVAEANATPLKELATPRFIAGQIATALEALTHGDVARDWVHARMDDGRERWSDDDRTMRTWLPEEVDVPLRKLLERPYTPNEALTLRILDQPAVRSMLADILDDAVRKFWQRMRNIEGKILGGVGSKARKRARGLGRGLLGGVATNLAGSVVGTVADELEGALDRRVKEFVSEATGRALQRMARQLSDPENAEAFGKFRIAVLDVLLDTPLSELTAEAEATRPEEIVDVVIEGIRAAVSAEDFVEQTERRVAAALDETGDGTLGAWLSEVGLSDVWSDTTAELLTDRLHAVVETDAFADWWERLFTA
jgi:hypothetical protein